MLPNDRETPVTDRPCNIHIREALEYSRQLIILADEGEAASSDDGCAVLYGIVRDCAYRMRAEAERERDRHKSLGMWENANV
jgi:hypothetical protein